MDDLIILIIKITGAIIRPGGWIILVIIGGLIAISCLLRLISYIFDPKDDNTGSGSQN